jgi:hypothetical protein
VVRLPLNTVLTYGPLLAIAAGLLILVYLQNRGTEDFEGSVKPVQKMAVAPVALSAIRLPDPPKTNSSSSSTPFQSAFKPITIEVAQVRTEVPRPLDAQPKENLPAEDDALAFLDTPLQPRRDTEPKGRKFPPPPEREVTPLPDTPFGGRPESPGKREPLKLSPVLLAQPSLVRRSDATGRGGAAKTTIKLTETAVQDGRALLRILEHGAGPEIEIAWPASVRERERLFAAFRDCYGMRIAALTDSGGLYALDNGVRRSWTLDLDTYSGFVRRPEGRLTEIERAWLMGAEADAIVGQLVRIFPRQVDAALLGGLKLVTGSAYAGAGSIQATYKINVGGGVAVTGIQIDGRVAGGSIDLRISTVRRCHIR